jgi:hypothetical protein
VLPVLEPMMSTWTYKAMKFEEQRSIDSNDERSSQAFDEACNIDDEAENIGAEDQEAGVSKKIHKSLIQYKLKFNDYVFDER